MADVVRVAETPDRHLSGHFHLFFAADELVHRLGEDEAGFDCVDSDAISCVFERGGADEPIQTGLAGCVVCKQRHCNARTSHR
ncbi:hypothetical protein FQZ97_1029950 [compost metagenome]